MQTKVYQVPSFAIHGGRSNLSDPEVFTHPTYKVSPTASKPVLIGGFFWATTAPSGASNEIQDQGWADGTGSGLPAGFAGYQPTYALASTATDTLTVPAGQVILGLEKTARYVLSATTPTVGQKVFATLADGSVQFGAAGATISGAIETDFVVKTVTSALDVSSGSEVTKAWVEISNL